MVAAPRFDVDVRVTRDLRHAPYLLDGLAAMEQAGDLRLALRPRRPRRRDRVVIGPEGPRRVARPYPWSVDLDVVDHEVGSTRRVSVDLQDWREMYSHSSLRHSDVIVKRMHTAPEVAGIERHFGVEVVPAGITGPGDAARWARRWPIRAAGLLGRIETVVDAPGTVREHLRRRPGGGGAVRDVLPEASTLPATFAFFQVAFHDWGDDAEAARLNQERATLIRGLREGLGPRFVGGMTFTGEPPEAFADCRSPLPGDRDAYLDVVEQAAVVVATNGFGGSPPWKLAEYLERGACIVSEPMQVRLPRPLEDGGEVRLFDDLDGAVAACAELLDAPDDRLALSRSAGSYYAEQVAPEAAARRFLTAGSEVVA